MDDPGQWGDNKGMNSSPADRATLDPAWPYDMRRAIEEMALDQLSLAQAHGALAAAMQALGHGAIAVERKARGGVWQVAGGKGEIENVHSVSENLYGLRLGGATLFAGGQEDWSALLLDFHCRRSRLEDFGGGDWNTFLEDEPQRLRQRLDLDALPIAQIADALAKYPNPHFTGEAPGGAVPEDVRQRGAGYAPEPTRAMALALGLQQAGLAARAFKETIVLPVAGHAGVQQTRARVWVEHGPENTRTDFIDHETARADGYMSGDALQAGVTTEPKAGRDELTMLTLANFSDPQAIIAGLEPVIARLVHAHLAREVASAPEGGPRMRM